MEVNCVEAACQTRSSRRKPSKTHRVSLDVETGLITVDNFVPESISDSSANRHFTERTQLSVCGSNIEISEDSDMDHSVTECVTHDLVLPEGTVIVHPEAVDDNTCQESGIDAVKKPSGYVIPTIVHCTACNQRIDTSKCDVIYQHPVLKVLLCKKCHSSQHKKRSAAGNNFRHCSWCACGIDLICCDYCSAMFCKICIRRNLGRGHLDNILSGDDDQKWHCFVCDPRPLSNMVNSLRQLVFALDERSAKSTDLETSTKVSLSSVPKSGSSSSAAGDPHGALLVTEHNVGPVLERLLATTQSMDMLLDSLTDDLRRSRSLGSSPCPSPDVTRRRREVVAKLYRAFMAYRKSFSDIESYAQRSMSILHDKSSESTASATVRMSNLVHQTQRVSRVRRSQPLSDEIIELSDSDDDGDHTVDSIEPEEKRSRVVRSSDPHNMSLLGESSRRLIDDTDKCQSIDPTGNNSSCEILEEAADLTAVDITLAGNNYSCEIVDEPADLTAVDLEPAGNNSSCEIMDEAVVDHKTTENDSSCEILEETGHGTGVNPKMVVENCVSAVHCATAR